MTTRGPSPDAPLGEPSDAPLDTPLHALRRDLARLGRGLGPCEAAYVALAQALWTAGGLPEPEREAYLARSWRTLRRRCAEVLGDRHPAMRGWGAAPRRDPAAVARAAFALAEVARAAERAGADALTRTLRDAIPRALSSPAR